MLFNDTVINKKLNDLAIEVDLYKKITIELKHQDIKHCSMIYEQAEIIKKLSQRIEKLENDHESLNQRTVSILLNHHF